MGVEHAIRVQGLWKEYLVGRAPRGTLYDALSSALRHPLRALRSRREAGEPFWALRDVNFDVRQGDVVGIVGRNGAGKSTLLKVLSRITAPTRGRVEVRGRLASLLEVGTGFHPELTGRENIFLNGAILGMRRAEIERKFDEIVAFAELDRFVDTPVKRYSSGMYVRLAFAVAAHLETDVLVVDEVLAVGDVAFQERCMNKMEDVSRGGRTVLFVSHNLGAVSRLCTRAVLLDRGQVICDADVSACLERYSREASGARLGQASGATGRLTKKVSIEAVSIQGSHQLVGTVCKPADEIVLKIRGRCAEALRGFRVTLCIHKQQQLVLGMHDAASPGDIGACDFESTFTIPPYFLSPGEYSLEVNMYSEATGDWLVARGMALFSVATEWATLYEPTEAMGLVNLRQSGRREILDGQEELAGDAEGIAP